MNNDTPDSIQHVMDDLDNYDGDPDTIKRALAALERYASLLDAALKLDGVFHEQN